MSLTHSDSFQQQLRVLVADELLLRVLVTDELSLAFFGLQRPPAWHGCSTYID
jgi:hypothetical protein